MNITEFSGLAGFLGALTGLGGGGVFLEIATTVGAVVRAGGDRLGSAVLGLPDGAVTHLIQLGLVALLLTPVARVAFSVFAFAAQRDRTYVIVTLIVLAILIASMCGFI
jgi:uncharacterized membrane protein